MFVELFKMEKTPNSDIKEQVPKTPCHLNRKAKMGVHKNPNTMLTSSYKGLFTISFFFFLNEFL